MGKKLILYRSRVREFYKKFYDKNDGGHLIDHADDVCNLALELAKENGYTGIINVKKVILSSYIHDIFTWKDRKQHHLLAGMYITERRDEFIKEFTDINDVLNMADAVRKHRASYKGERENLLEIIIASADRGKPDLDKIIDRSLSFNSKLEDDSTKIQLAFEHIKDKYGTNGYVNYPEFYKKIFSKELKEFNKQVNDLTIDQINIKV